MIGLLIGGLLGLVLTLVGTPLFIRFLVRKGYGQFIRDDGPTTHKTKRGTPTMGGGVFVVVTVVAYFLTHWIMGGLGLENAGPTASAMILLFLMAGMGLVGFLDDFSKISNQRSLGLTPWAKIVLQGVVGTAFAVLALNFPDGRGLTPASTAISFVRDLPIDLAFAGPVIGVILFVVWSNLITTATTNAVNLTDGLDGLATGATAMITAAYMLITIFQSNQACSSTGAAAGCYAVRDPLDLAMLGAILTGSLMGFLWWNTSPAKIFMGDTGSLALGGALAGFAILSRTELLVIVLAGLMVLITLSVIIQVGYFKLSGGKRVFLMAPLQHHFELKGWAEVTVVVRFWLIGLLCVVLGVSIFYGEWVLVRVTAGSVAGNPRLDRLTSWDADWTGLRVVVAGLGLSGFSAADTLAELGADVVVVDGRDSTENQARADTLRIVGVRQVLLGEDHARSLPDVGGSAAELVVTSPGWRPDQPLLAAAADAGIPVWGDVELAWRVRERAGRKTADWLVVTGTNGKTTTVGMVESMLLAAGLRAVACGNVGTPILDAIRDPEGWDVIAVELSSFQLHWTHHIEPAASAVLNVAEDHVDWHGSFEAYCADKARIYENTREACIFNEAQPETMRMVERADVQDGCRAVSFTTDTPGLSMVGVVDGILVDRAFLDERAHQALELGHVEDLGPIAPRHQVANALAAAALVRAIGVAPEAVRDGLRSYRPGEHRIQLVAKADDVLWINDSKATNPHAADASLGAFTDVVWIAGGLPKGVTYDELVSRHAHRLRAVVLIGADPSELAGALQRHAPDVPVLSTAVRDTGGEPSDGHRAMDAAVRRADDAARPGDVVLMAPAAASMDQFTSYADRGNAFIDAVARLMEHKGLSS